MAKMKKARLSFKLLCLLFLVVTILSCIVISQKPLGEKQSSIIDPNLLGIWYNVKEEGYLAILKRDDGYLKFILFDNSDEPPLELQGYISQIDKERFLNLQLIETVNDKREPKKYYIFAHYYINQNNELAISLFNYDFFKKAIKAGLIKGEIKKKSIMDLKLTDSTKNLINFIKNHKKEEYLDKAIILKKMRLEQ
ncbi:MAG: hypothetical protein LWW95_09220 [Candidatus Desulfofervidus auxilii]|nr:hypothetical protein [Candidatus Desulfofervidus auxilii]